MTKRPRMLVCSKQRLFLVDIISPEYMGDQRVESTNQLGVWIDSNLTRDEQIYVCM